MEMDSSEMGTSIGTSSSVTMFEETDAENGDCVTMVTGLKMECVTETNEMEPIIIDVKEEVWDKVEEVEDCGVMISLQAEDYSQHGQVKSDSLPRDNEDDFQIKAAKEGKQITIRKFAIKNSTKPKFQCSVCGKLFKAAAYLAHHIILKHVHTRCKCNVCGKWYLNAAFLAKHKVSHSQPTENQCTKHNDYDDLDNNGANERDQDMAYDVLKERTQSCAPPGRTVVEITPAEQSVGNAKRKSTRLKESRNGDQDYEVYIKTEDYHDDGGDYYEEGGDYSEGGGNYHKVGYQRQLPLDEDKDSESNVPRIVQGRMEEADDFKKSYTTKKVAKKTDFRKSDPQSDGHDDHDDGSDPEDETATDARYRCKTCNQKFVSSRDLAKHSRTNHEIHDDPIRCSVCNKVFTLKCTLTRHMMLHTGEKRYSCQSCDQKFFRQVDVERHMIKCHGAKKFECDICGSGFYTRTYLIVHRKSHFDTYSWQCKLCEKMFKHQRYLKKHVTVIHSDSRPFECSFCKKCFKEKRNLDLHLRIHSDEKAYPCELCEKRYRTKGHLNDHQIAKHGFKPRWMKEMLC